MSWQIYLMFLVVFGGKSFGEIGHPLAEVWKNQWGVLPNDTTDFISIL